MSRPCPPRSVGFSYSYRSNKESVFINNVGAASVTTGLTRVAVRGCIGHTTGDRCVREEVLADGELDRSEGLPC